MRFMIGRELEWDPITESVVLYNLGAGRPGSFQWSDHFLGVFKQHFGYECPSFLPLDQRVDNSNCIAVLQQLGFQRSSHKDCIITAAVLDKDLAQYGLVVDRYSDGSETVYVDENKYAVNKMLQISTGTANPSLCVHGLLMRCRALKSEKAKQCLFQHPGHVSVSLG